MIHLLIMVYTDSKKNMGFGLFILAKLRSFVWIWDENEFPGGCLFPILVEDTEVFITLPVAKVHAMTTVSLAAKNQWGCIASEKRCLFHSAFNEIICGLNKLLPKQVVICDGRYVLTDNGPMFRDRQRRAVSGHGQ